MQVQMRIKGVMAQEGRVIISVDIGIADAMGEFYLSPEDARSFARDINDAAAAAQPAPRHFVLKAEPGEFHSFGQPMES